MSSAGTSAYPQPAPPDLIPVETTGCWNRGWKTLVLALGLAGGCAAGMAAEFPPLRFGFSDRIFIDVNSNDARAALRVWAQTLGTERSIPVAQELAFLSGPEAIIGAMREGRVDAVTVSAFEFWHLRREVRLNPRVILGVTRSQTTQEYLLLVHAQSPVTSLAGLHRTRLTILDAAPPSLAAAWLETLLLEAGHGTLESFVESLTYGNKLTRVVLPVFFRQSDACIVTREGFLTMCELNPQVGRQLRILAQSPPLVSTPFCFRADLNSPYSERLLDEIDLLATTPAGRQTLNLFQADQLKARPISELDATCALLDHHGRLLTKVQGAPDTANVPEKATP